MKTARTVLVLLSMLVCMPWRVSSQSGITVNNAHAILTQPVASSSELDQVTAPVGLRVAIQYADANVARQLASVPAPLYDLIAIVPARITIQYADGNQTRSLIYPRELMADTQPPQFSNIVTEQVLIDSVIIRWQTNEFADTEVKYGTSQGEYAYSQHDTLYAKTHELHLEGLSQDTMYHFVVIGTDQSGNQAQSGEVTFKIEQPEYPCYLPAVIKHR